MIVTIPELKAAVLKAAEFVAVDPGVLPIFEAFERDLAEAKLKESALERARALREKALQ